VAVSFEGKYLSLSPGQCSRKSASAEPTPDEPSEEAKSSASRITMPAQPVMTIPRAVTARTYRGPRPRSGFSKLLETPLSGT
jgi:hypothetical protein